MIANHTHLTKLPLLNAQDLSHLKFEEYDAEFNRTLAAAKTLSSLDEVSLLMCASCMRSTIGLLAVAQTDFLS